ncbi:Histidine kinase [Flexibacter flexilis DSM 6793]|uniref:Histidine kinase n=1 Tax=Flexibacter flexilis DSM 6793 TaxID=927664 RepID=A0A1I1DKK6_9BACT|nr:histidine kinase [Flexibacter flexilis]SFB75509.1 Histidine kinase [Flexibacter flexilis DSM 6793]
MKNLLKHEYFKHVLPIIIVGCCIPLVVNIDKGRTLGVYMVVSVFCTATYWLGTVGIMNMARNIYPRHDQTFKRISYQLAWGLLYIFAAFWVNQWGIYMAFHVWCADYWDDFKVPLFISIFIGTIYECMYLLEHLTNSIAETERLKRENIQSELDSLKNQVNPHFLFNSLNTLASLIEEEPKTAVAYVQELSQVYRYILQSKDQELTTLREEIKFIKAYLFLVKMRFGENIKTQIHISDDFLEKQIPPLTLQILVENAIKHNVISAAKPLDIDIFIEGGQLVVRNKFQKKTTMVDSNKVGLRNIANRYKLIASENIEVLQNALYFTVMLPLLGGEE